MTFLISYSGSIINVIICKAGFLNARLHAPSSEGWTQRLAFHMMITCAGFSRLQQLMTVSSLSCKPTTAWCWDLSTFTFTCFLHAWCALSACWVANPFDGHSWTNMKSAETVILLKTKSSEFSIFKPFIFVVFPHSKIPANTFLWASCA